MKDNIIIKVHGHLDNKWRDWFDGLDIAYEGNITILSGEIQDNASFHGILNQIRDLNLKLISAQIIENKSNI